MKFWLKIEILDKHRNVEQKWKCGSKIEIFVKNWNFWSKAKSWLKIEIFVKKSKISSKIELFGKKSNVILSKIEILVKIQNFSQKSKFGLEIFEIFYQKLFSTEHPEGRQPTVFWGHFFVRNWKKNILFFFQTITRFHAELLFLIWFIFWWNSSHF